MFALLAGCEGEVTVDLATELPADPDITQVIAHVRGLEFEDNDGNTETIEFDDTERLDFMDYTDDDDILRLFTTEELPDGDWTGVRLLFDDDYDDDEYVTVSGDQVPMNVNDGDYADIDFEVSSDDSSSSEESYTLMLDLRKSLSYDEDDDEYTFDPSIRAVVTDEASTLEGDIDIDCPSGDSLDEGAVYLFEGSNEDPDDIDDSGVEPYATAPVYQDSDGSYFYRLRWLEEGHYTLAVTCIGNDEDAETSEDLEFRDEQNVSIDEDEDKTLDLD